VRQGIERHQKRTRTVGLGGRWRQGTLERELEVDGGSQFQSVAQVARWIVQRIGKQGEEGVVGFLRLEHLQDRKHVVAGCLASGLRVQPPCKAGNAVLCIGPRNLGPSGEGHDMAASGRMRCMGPLQLGRQALKFCLQARSAPCGGRQDVFDFDRVGLGLFAQGVDVHGTALWVDGGSHYCGPLPLPDLSLFLLHLARLCMQR